MRLQLGSIVKRGLMRARAKLAPGVVAARARSWVEKTRRERYLSQALGQPASAVKARVHALADAGRFQLATALITRLACRGDTELAMAAARSVGKRPGSEAARMEAAWQLLHRRGMSALLAELWPTQEAGPAPPLNLRIIDAASGATRALAAEGLDVRAILENAKDDLLVTVEIARALELGSAPTLQRLASLAAGRARSGFESSMLRGMNGIDLGFQAAGLALGHILGHSPWTGRPIASSHAFVVQVDANKSPYLFVWFNDVEPWYLMVGTWRGCKSHIFVPGRNLVILLQSPGHEWGRLEEYIASFRAAALKRAPACSAYLESVTRPALLAGTVNNLGHFFWNEVQGLVNVHAEGLFDSVDEAVLYKYQFLDLAALFPELRNMHVSQIRDADQLFARCIERQLLCIRPTAFVMDSRAATRIRETAMHLATQQQRRALAEIADCAPKIWFNLRAHNKVWLNQVDGVSAICEALAPTSGRVALILDGTPDCSALVTQIRAAAPAGVIVVDATSISLADSVAWAYEVDAYVATIGSGLTLTTWLAGKPGVAHSETAHWSQMAFWGEVRPDVPAPVTPTLAQIRDVGKGMYCDYEVNPDLIANLLQGALRERARCGAAGEPQA